MVPPSISDSSSFRFATGATSPAGTLLVGAVHAASIVNTVRQPLLLLDGGARVILANRAFYRFFHVGEGETVGVSLFSLGDGQWDNAELRRLWERLTTDRAVIEDFEVTHEFPGLGRRVIELSARVLETSPSAEPLFLIALDDISQRKAEEDMQARRLGEVERSNRELEQFAYVASHDLQEPLRKIRAYGELLLQEKFDQIDEAGQDYVRRMIGAGGRMSALIADLLALSRVTTATLIPERTALDRVLDDVLIDLDVMLQGAGGHVERTPLPDVVADPVQLRQLVQNLLGNALKFRREGVPPHIRVAGSIAGERVVVTVTDNGIGFEARYTEQIFAPFQRLHPRGAFEGTGIGLAICRRIVERHGGTITADSTLGSGSTFTFTLPGVPAETP